MQNNNQNQEGSRILDNSQIQEQNISLSIDIIDVDPDLSSKNKNKSNPPTKRTFAKGISQFDQLCQKNIRSNKGDKEQNQAIMAKRVRKFFHYGVKLDISQDYFRPRIQPIYQNAFKKNGSSLHKEQKNADKDKIVQEEAIFPVDDQIILYGIDFISIKELKKIYKPTSYKLVDQSHVRLKYDSYQEVLDVLIKNQRQNVFENQIKLQAGQRREITRKWVQLNCYYKDSEQRRLIARFITNYQRQNLQVNYSKNNLLYEKARQVYQRKKKQKQEIEQNYQRRYFNLNNQAQNENDYNNISYDNSSVKEKRQRSRDKLKNDGNGKFAKTLMKPTLNQCSNSNISYVQQGNKNNQNDDKSSDLSFILRDLSQYKVQENDEDLTPGQLVHQMNNLQLLNQKESINLQDPLNLEDQDISIQFNKEKQKQNAHNFSRQMSKSNNSMEISYSLSQNMPGRINLIQNTINNRPYGSNGSGIEKKFNYKNYVQQTQRNEQQQKQKKKITYIELSDDQQQQEKEKERQEGLGLIATE